MVNYWLMKAEAESRLVRGKDVKFSVEDFEECKETAWEGVRNHEAKNIMKDKMKVGDGVLFYHSNCRVPGVAALATVSKEGYPDHSAWDPSHSYYDEKTDKSNPRWFMVSVEFTKRLTHFVPLALLRELKNLSTLPPDLSYLNSTMLKGIADMPLLSRGRLSIQSVPPDAWEAVILLGEKGGWGSIIDEGGKPVTEQKAEKKKPIKTPKSRKAKVSSQAELEEDGDLSELSELSDIGPPKITRKRKEKPPPDEGSTRRSQRRKI